MHAAIRQRLRTRPSAPGLAVAAAATLLAALFAAPAAAQALAPYETLEARSERLRWWRDARFGMFIHWGLYAVPGGVWNGAPVQGAGEWLLTNARIDPPQYEPLLGQFNPVDFDAKAWVDVAADAGMRYIVITSKHHDGFCLWPSELTTWDVESTPFKRDILGELAAACEARGIRFCLYHSIMDWHHPDYLPRRPWDSRPATGAQWSRYTDYMKGQLKELLSRYPTLGLLWFDGEWESTWTHEQGRELYDWLRTIKPSLIINNRVDTGRSGMAGLTRDGEYRGDYGTPEQEIPATGLPENVDWETCMTMNDTWGFKVHDHNWKSAETMIRMLVDIASKGGNFLLNVGPDDRGRIPQPSVERLRAMGRWTRVNGDAIYGTSASPFPQLPWGRCTRRALPDGGTRLYLCIFDWPGDGRLNVPGLLNSPRRASILGAHGGGRALPVSRQDEGVLITLAGPAPDPACTVVALDVDGAPDVAIPPTIDAESELFTERLEVTISPGSARSETRYTLDGSDPVAASPKVSGPVTLEATATVKARTFVEGRGVTPVTARAFKKVKPSPAQAPGAAVKPGVVAGAAAADGVRRTSDIPAATTTSVVPTLTLDVRPRDEHFGVVYTGLIDVPANGVWRFTLESDDGSVLVIDDAVVVEHDGPHGTTSRQGQAVLAKGLHPFRLAYFNGTGQRALRLMWKGPGTAEGVVPASAFFHRE